MSRCQQSNRFGRHERIISKVGCKTGLSSRDEGIYMSPLDLLDADMSSPVFKIKAELQ